MSSTRRVRPEQHSGRVRATHLFHPLSGLRSAELDAAVWQRFGVSVHPRFGRAGAPGCRTSWREDEQAPRAAPKSL
jgi:hypothetical protein